jgi:6-pyruvoyltetrahydropterin/6-carboxytetrahydropterin synthase
MDWLKQFSPQKQPAESFAPIQLPVSEFRASEPALVQRAMATGMAYELAMDSFFGASHAIRPSGETHTHSFRVQATFVTDSVDDNGMICGFREVSDMLDGESRRYVNRFINDLKPFDVVQPTGENLATVIFRNLLTALEENMPGGPQLVSVTLWENPTSSVRVGMWRAA